MVVDTAHLRRGSDADGEEDDSSLMAAIAEGNHAAFHELMRRHMPLALSVAQRMTGNRADADEVAQEAFLRVWTGAARWRPDGQARLRTWLFRVVVNLCLDRRRRATALPLEEAGDPADPSPDCVEQIASAQTARLISGALDQLPPRQKAAITLCYYGGFSGNEAAGILEVSASALESLLVRARRALRGRLAGAGLWESKGEEP